MPRQGYITAVEPAEAPQLDRVVLPGHRHFCPRLYHCSAPGIEPCSATPIDDDDDDDDSSQNFFSDLQNGSMASPSFSRANLRALKSCAHLLTVVGLESSYLLRTVREHHLGCADGAE